LKKREIKKEEKIPKKSENKENLKFEVLPPSVSKPEFTKEEEEKTKSIIKSKIKEVKNNYNFCIQYDNILFKIIKYLDHLTYERISNSIEDNLNFLSFFKNSSDLYTKFIEQIKISNSIILNSPEKPKINDKFLNEHMQIAEGMFLQNFTKFCAGITQNIVSKNNSLKIQEKVNKIDSIKKNLYKKFTEIEEKKLKVEKKYKLYENLFDTFLPEDKAKKENNNQSNNPNQLPDTLVDSVDFVYVIKDIIVDIIDLIKTINEFIVETKESFNSIHSLFLEINDLTKESILTYIQESKIFFNIEINKEFEKIEEHFKKLEETKENVFKLEIIFNNEKNKEIIQTILQQYFELLNNSEKVNKDLLTDKNNFSVDKYANIILFYEWLISVSPQPTDVNVEELILKKMEIKRDPGFFFSWKDAVLVFTKQQHMIVFDKPDSFVAGNVVEVFELDKSTYKKKADNKKPFLFEINANVKGKVMTFKGSYTFDALNSQNVADVAVLIPNETKS